MKYTQRIKDLREDADLKQADVANILNMKQQQYQRYESGVQEIPLRHIITLCKHYDVSADYILGFTNILKRLPHDGRRGDF